MKNTQILQSTAVYGDEEVMICPWCGFESSHIDEVSLQSATHGGMRLVARGEDEGSNVTVQQDGSGGFRRHTVVLHFDCEGCHGGEIVLRQHKGNTFVTKRANVPHKVGDFVSTTKQGTGTIVQVRGEGNGYEVSVLFDGATNVIVFGDGFGPQEALYMLTADVAA